MKLDVRADYNRNGPVVLVTSSGDETEVHEHRLSLVELNDLMERLKKARARSFGLFVENASPETLEMFKQVIKGIS